MAKKNIGDLHATVTADAVQFVSEFKRADAAATKSATSIKRTLSQQLGDQLGKTGQKFAMGFIGAAALGSVIGQIREVSQNIENIPGVPESTVASIQRMNYELAQSKLMLNQATATLASGFSNFGTSLGIGVGALVYGTDAAAGGMRDLSAEAERFTRADFNKQMGDLVAEFERLEQVDKGAIADDLDREAAALEAFVETGKLQLEEFSNARLEALQSRVSMQGGATQKDRDDAALQAMRDRISAQRTENDLLRDYKATLESSYAAQQADYLSTLSTTGALKELEQQRKALESRHESVNATMSGSERIKEITEITKLYGEIDHKIFTIQHSVKTASMEMRDAFVGAFQDMGDQLTQMIMTGEGKLTDFLDVIAQAIVSTFIKLAVINPFLNGIFGGTTGWVQMASMFGGGKASGGDVSAGTTYLVGEQGPELFTPKASGSITPNNRLASLGGSSGDSYHFTYNIPAGVTRADLLPALEATKRATIAEIRDMQRRGKN